MGHGQYILPFPYSERRPEMAKRGNSRWYYHLRGQVYAYGPTQLMTEIELLDFLRRAWGNGKRIPYGTGYWRTR